MDKKTLITIIISVVITSLICFGAFFFFFHTSSDKQHFPQEANATQNSTSTDALNTEVHVEAKQATQSTYDKLREKNKKFLDQVNTNHANRQIEEKEILSNMSASDIVKHFGYKVDKFFIIFLLKIQHINVSIITILTLFGVVMSWFYREVPIKSKGWIAFTVLVPVIYICSIYIPAIYGSFQ